MNLRIDDFDPAKASDLSLDRNVSVVSMRQFSPEKNAHDIIRFREHLFLEGHVQFRSQHEIDPGSFIRHQTWSASSLRLAWWHCVL